MKQQGASGMSDKEYLGDNVYVDFMGFFKNGVFDVVLTTGDEKNPNNRIVLNPAVYKALTKYVKHLREKYSK